MDQDKMESNVSGSSVEVKALPFVDSASFLRLFKDVSCCSATCNPC